ncbi:conserved hypothetical protein [Sphingomonas sp. EC-HK361]|uniref:DUF4357 domain-containing protein n=1 Tax=Sphingomonas sp. EC-HK361 TaxID=2038397 RepID=UPI001256055A|nr:DUF4357 domain-containing protein [Sphingomonas sp. EC-HK361]VVT22942.1 conserved hypothetical protein [Sphingomonas sp. EC-HK361]
MQIEIDFDVFKALTARRRSEAHNYNDVLREMLDLEKAVSDRVQGALSASGSTASGRGFPLRGGDLPNGTDLRASYKGEQFRAKIREGRWYDEQEREHSSPSAAASAISGTNVNGLRFWHARRPGDDEWLRLDILLAMPS